MNNRSVIVTVTNRTIVRTILWIVLAIILYKFIGRISHGLTLIFAAFFLTLALNPVVSWMSRRLKLKSRIRATAASYLVVIIILAAFFALVIPPLVSQTRSFISTVPQTVQNFQDQNSNLAKAARKYKIDQKISQGAKDFSSHYSNYGSAVLDTGKRVAEALASILAVLVLTFMMLVEGPRWLELFWGVMPPKNRQRHKRIAAKMYRGVTGFVNGQVILAIIAGVFAFIALEISSHIVHASINALALAGIVSVFGLIPLFGNPIAAVLVILACLINAVSLGIIMLIYFVVYFFIENHTFQPYIQSRLNELTPLTVFVAAVLGVGFGGLLGAIIAIPAASAIKVLVEDYFERHRHRDAPTHKLPAAS
jgi:predicted PurR-regulated permease PerM